MPETPNPAQPASLARALAVSATTLADYQKNGGMQAYQQAVGQGDSGAAAVMREVRTAKLRGRGGAGALTADKWQAVLDAVERRGGPPVLVCNAYDADPRSLIAKTLLAGHPFLVLEGIALAAYAIGANEAFLYMRSSNRQGYTAALNALHQVQDAGVFGNLTVTIAGVEVGFMGGEESTMLQVLRGYPAKATQRPPYPSQAGVHDLPTAVDNIETLVQVVSIMRNGAPAFQKMGSPSTPGTKLVSVYDAEGKGQLLEVAFGTPISGIVKQAGIALTPESVRGIVVGGPEGGVLPPAQWNTPFDFEPLTNAGTIVGSSTIEVLPADTCMVSWAQARSGYLSAETCGRCIPCRVGVKRISGVLETIMSDIGTKADLDVLTEFGEYVPNASICGFGWNATHPVKTAMQYYPDDFAKHLQGECPTGTCIPVRSHRYATKGVL